MLLSSLFLLTSLSPLQEGAGASVAAADTAFACDLYARLASQEGNLFLSPYSVSVALAMTLEGAAGDTAAQMEEVLGQSQGGVADAFAQLARELVPSRVRDRDSEVEAYKLRVANALWVQEGFEYREQFAETLRSAYRAGFADVDFRLTEQARQRINGWTGKQTEQMIKELIPDGYLSRDTALVLTNAVYLKAAWQHAFSERLTANEPFTTQDGRRTSVPMMRRTGTYRFFESEDAMALELPYLGGDLAMLVVLPKVDGLAALEAQLNPQLLAAWSAALESTNVAVKLPRFRISSPFDLTGTLKAAGMTDAFERDRADFSGISQSDRLFISSVVHQAHVAVDEKGTEAAAATAVTLSLTGLPSEPTANFTADHPFLFLIQHRKTGCILFMGRVADPAQNPESDEGTPSKTEGPGK
jgi:serpin B